MFSIIFDLIALVTIVNAYASIAYEKYREGSILFTNTFYRIIGYNTNNNINKRL